MPGGGDARNLVEGQADVVGPDERRLTGVDAHSDLEHVAIGPDVLGEVALAVGGGRECRSGVAEGRKYGIALGPEGSTAMLLDGPFQDRTVLGQDRAVTVAQFLQETRRAFDVREQEGHRSRGQGTSSLFGWLGRHRAHPLSLLSTQDKSSVHSVRPGSSRRDACARAPSGTGVVGAAGFEPAISCSQSTCVTGLRYTPNRSARPMSRSTF